jgi:hypothetical protein
MSSPRPLAHPPDDVHCSTTTIRHNSSSAPVPRAINYLASDPDLLPVAAPVLDALANLVLVSIDMRTINMRIPRLQRNLDRISDLAFLRQPSHQSPFAAMEAMHTMFPIRAWAV